MTMMFLDISCPSQYFLVRATRDCEGCTLLTGNVISAGTFDGLAAAAVYDERYEEAEDALGG